MTYTCAWMYIIYDKYILTRTPLWLQWHKQDCMSYVMNFYTHTCLTSTRLYVIYEIYTHTCLALAAVIGLYVPYDISSRTHLLGFNWIVCHIWYIFTRTPVWPQRHQQDCRRGRGAREWSLIWERLHMCVTWRIHTCDTTSYEVGQEGS